MVSALVKIPTAQAVGATVFVSGALVWKLRHSIQCYWIDKAYRGPQNVDRSRQVAVVTGGNRGLGLAMAKELARYGVGNIVLACRNVSLGKDAADSVRAAAKSGTMAKVEVEELDLSSILNVDAFADRFLKAHDRLDILVCNAGISTVPEGSPSRCVDTGACFVFQENYLGHYRLWRRLHSALTATATLPGELSRARVVSVSSGASKRATIEWDDTAASGFRYGQSKLAQIMASKYEQRRVPDGVDLKYVSVTPGAVWTDMLSQFLDGAPLWQRCAFTLAVPLLWCLLRSPHVGAQTMVMAALDDDIVGGGYYSNCCERESEGRDGVSNDVAAQQKLVELSDKLLESAKVKTT